MTRFWSDYQELEERLFDDVRLTKLAVDVVVDAWAPVEATIAAWLKLPPAQVIDPGDLERFVGAYLASDGTVAHVEHTGGSLRVHGLRQVWPGQHLVAVECDAFECSLPFTIRFDGNAMRVEGPELLASTAAHAPLAKGRV